MLLATCYRQRHQIFAHDNRHSNAPRHSLRRIVVVLTRRRGGTDKIREALRSPSANGTSESGIDVLADGAIDDAGDVEFIRRQDPREAITNAVRNLAKRGGRPISLGGDHSMTYPILKALAPVIRI